MNLGSKMILDATSSRHQRIYRPAYRRGPRPAPKLDDPLRSGNDRTGRILSARIVDDNTLVVSVRDVRGRSSGAGKNVKFTIVAPTFPLVVAVSADVRAGKPNRFCYGAFFTRFDCARDTFFERAEIVHGHAGMRAGRMFIDASLKPGYPDPALDDRRDRETGL